MIAVEDVVRATGAPAHRIRANWPLVYAALQKHGIASQRSQVAMIATITVECPPWKPISEWGEHPEYDTGRKAERLGNTPEADGDGQLFEGRGFIQLTGRANYAAYGRLMGVDLVRSPALALNTDVASEIAALYFKQRKVNEAADAGDWQRVRKLVNGGLNGWDHFAKVVIALGESA